MEGESLGVNRTAGPGCVTNVLDDPSPLGLSFPIIK